MSNNSTETFTDDFLSKLVSNDLRTYKDFAEFEHFNKINGSL